MNEATKMKEVTTEVGLPVATLAGADKRPEALTDAAQRFGVGSASSAGAATASAIDEQSVALFSPQETKDFRAQWDTLQVGFVDEPRQAVQQADKLVDITMKRLGEMFATERARLEGQLDQGDTVSTEDLRLALRRYRSFFGRLLSM